MQKNLISLSALFVLFVLFFAAKTGKQPVMAHPDKSSTTKRPNILFVISDDQSYPHASAYGYQGISTPAFDRVAREGVLFTNAFSASPGCSPSRAAILTGKNCWQLEQAGTHASSFSQQFKTYPDLLEASGYFIGHTGKGWGPGNFKISGRSRNPAGPAFSKLTMEAPKGISNNDYAANFKNFLSSKPQDKPFCFWFGAQEPHRRYPTGIGKRSGMDISKVRVPGFLPGSDEVKSDIMDYLYEIQWFDNHLARIIQTLEETGDLDNTIIVVTSDNGMPFPRAKANVYEYGIHLPLAICWASKVKGNRKIDDPVSLTDLAPTFLEAAGVPFDAKTIAGKSLMNILTGEGQGEVDKSREAVYASRERHSSSRWNNLGYPQRCIRTRQYLYIWNVYPDRWPAGDPQEIKEGGKLAGLDSAYFDIDDFNESYVFSNRKKPDVAPFFHMAVDRRPGQELYDIIKDPACLHNLAAQSNMKNIVAALDKKLKSYLTTTGDPRMGKNGEIFETYERFSPLRSFPPPR